MKPAVLGLGLATWVADRLTAALGNPLALRGFWDAPIFYPEPGALALSEHFIPQTVLILPESEPIAARTQ